MPTTKLTKYLFITILALLVVFAVAYPFVARNLEKSFSTLDVKQGNISTYWDDAANPNILPILFASDVMTISQYIDFQVREGTTVIDESSYYLGNGYETVGTGQVDTGYYQFDLGPGNYEVYCRLRIEVDAVNLAVGTTPDDLVITNDRTFYGVYIENGQVITNDENQFALCDTQNVNYDIYLPIIMKH